MKWFSFDKFGGDYELFETELEAIDYTKASIAHYLGKDIPEDVTGKIGYGKVIKSAGQKTIAEKKILQTNNGAKRDIALILILYVL